MILLSITTARGHSSSTINLDGLLYQSTTGQQIGVDLLNVEPLSSALLYKISRFIQRLLNQEIWRVTAIRDQHDIILNGRQN